MPLTYSTTHMTAQCVVRQHACMRWAHVPMLYTYSTWHRCVCVSVWWWWLRVFMRLCVFVSVSRHSCMHRSHRSHFRPTTNHPTQHPHTHTTLSVGLSLCRPHSQAMEPTPHYHNTFTHTALQPCGTALTAGQRQYTNHAAWVGRGG